VPEGIEGQVPFKGPAEAVQLSWTRDGRAALAAEIRDDFAKVAAAPKGLAAGGYASLSAVRMSDTTIDALASAGARPSAATSETSDEPKATESATP